MVCYAPDFTSKRQIDQISLFTALSALPPDDRLHPQHVFQRNVPLQGACLAFLHSDGDTVNASAVGPVSRYAAIAATKSPTFLRIIRSKDCRRSGPFADRRLIQAARHKNGHTNYKRIGRGAVSTAPSQNPNNGSSVTTGGGTTTSESNAHMPIYQESAGVSAFILRHYIIADNWLCDAAASC